MIQIETVVCPVDFTELSQRELDTAAALSQAFASRLIVHHNVSATPPGLTRGWEWDELHRTAAPDQAHAEQLLQRLLARLPAGVRAQACITSGSPFAALMALADSLPAQLIVMGSHGWSTPDHVSFGERVVDRSRCPVLTIPEIPGGHASPLQAASLQQPLDVIVATDLSSSASVAVEYAFGLSRILPMRLQLLHVAHRSGDAARASQTLSARIPADVASVTQVHVACGDPTEQILNFVTQQSPALLVMGQHARGMLRGFLSHDTSTDILHKASVPVWFVPPMALA
jgi:universal stress protein A